MHRTSAALFAVCAALTFGLITIVQAQNPDHIRQLRETKKCVGCDFNKADLQGAALDMADVQNSDFRLAQMYKVNLRGANLTGAMFTGADLSGADLRNTKGADLVGAITNEMTQCPNGAAGPCQ